ncbi:lipopolysaccharide heptosyltransferase I [Candidatus Thioglobus sp.]|nr:lipopolysaccharide heptosyltransferase I [Candidatus Thioglobus sp.]
MKIAIVKLSALGDIVHAMVVLQFIKNNNQSIDIDWIVESRYRELLELHPDINIVHKVNIKEFKKNKSLSLLYKEFKGLRKLGPYDLVVDMQGLIKSAVISKLIPSKLTIGFDKFSARERLASIFYNKTFKFSYDKNVIERNFELIKFALNLPFKLDEISNKLPFLYSNHKYVNPNFSNIQKNIILIPGASFSSKRYPVEGFVELVNLLNANYFVIWGNDEEKLLAEKIEHLAPHVKICEKLSIEALISFVSQADLIIGSDTGPTHIGWALNIPSITLFGPTPGYRNAWITDNNKIIESNSEVDPHRINKNDHTIKSINATKIAQIARGLMYKK